MTSQDVMTLLGIDAAKIDAKKESYINSALPLLIDFVKEHCNNKFLDDAGNEVIPGGVKVAVAKMIEYNMNKAGKTMAVKGSVTDMFTVDFPRSIMRLLEPYQRVSVL
jgi:hypothetical protein